MEIRRLVSDGSGCLVATAQLPALLEVVDERQVPVEFSLDPGTGPVSVLAESVRYRPCGPMLLLDAGGNSIRINLDSVALARVVGRQGGCRRRLAVQLLGVDGTVLLALTGPESGSGLAADIWQLVVEALLPAGGEGSRLRPSRAVSGAIPGAVPASGQWPGPAGARPTGASHRRDPALATRERPMPLAAASGS